MRCSPLQYRTRLRGGRPQAAFPNHREGRAELPESLPQLPRNGDLQNDNKTKDEAHAAEIHQLKVNNAIESALTGAKAKNALAVKALLKDLDKAELAEDGTVKGLAEQIAALQKSDAYLFEAKESKPKMKGASVGESADGDTGITKEQFNKMSYKDRMNLYKENKELYDSLTKE